MIINREYNSIPGQSHYKLSRTKHLYQNSKARRRFIAPSPSYQSTVRIQHMYEQLPDLMN